MSSDGRMKCLLVDPLRRAVNVVKDNVVRQAVETGSRFPPIGLAYLASSLRAHGVEVEIIDAKSMGMPHEELAELVANAQPDLVGLTVFTSNLKSALDACELIRTAYPPTKIVVGGAHVHPCHRELIEKPFIDFCVRGEGETTIVELVGALSGEGSLEQVKGLTFKAGDRVVVTPDRPFTQDLDALPFPARDLLPNHLYTARLGNRPGRFTAVSASRGCPFHCDYCSVPRFWSALRRRSVHSVLDELAEVADVYEIGNVRFTDELITASRKWLVSLCRGMIERGLSEKIGWSCDSRVDTVSEGTLAEMKAANCQVIFYGIEFGSQRILDECGKGTKVSQIKKTIQMTKDAGIVPTGNFMIGYPTETREDIEATIHLIKALDLEFSSASVVTPFPGTALYDKCKRNGWLRSDNWEEYSYFHPQHGVIALPSIKDDLEFISLYRKAHFMTVLSAISDDLQQEVGQMLHTAQQ